MEICSKKVLEEHNSRGVVEILKVSNSYITITLVMAQKNSQIFAPFAPFLERLTTTSTEHSQ